VLVVSSVLVGSLVAEVVLSETVLVALSLPVVVERLDNEQPGLTSSLVLQIVDNLVVEVVVCIVGVVVDVVVVVVTALLVFDVGVWEVVEISMVAFGI